MGGQAEERGREKSCDWGANAGEIFGFLGKGGKKV